jgi:hypothetical protein
MKIPSLLALSALLFCFTGSPAFAANQDEELLRGLEQAWVTAASTGDRVTLAKLLDETFIETSSNGTRRSKSDLLAASPPPASSSQFLTDINVQVQGDTGVVSGTNRFKPSLDAQAVNYSFTDVFVRRAEGWRAVSSQMIRR